MEELKIIYLPPGDLTPYAKNAKRHPDEQVQHIANSIREFGFRQPIVVDADNVVVIGHGRLMAAKELGLETVPVVRADDLTEEQIKALRLADNKTNESEWDFSLLEAELAELSLDFDMSDFGFEDIETTETDATEVEEDDFDPDAEVEPRAKLGDIYQLGRHRLMCGDSTDVNAVDALTNGDKPDTYFIDPPYECEELYDIIPQNDGGRLFVLSDHKHWQKAVSAATAAGWIGRFELIWDCVQSWYTPNRPLARHKTCYIFGDVEYWDFNAAIIHDGKEREEKYVWNTRGKTHYIPLDGAVHIRTVEAFPNTAQNDENSYGKPVKWLVAMLNGYSGDTVLDLFGGSGAVMIACEQTGRTCLTMEINPHYVDLIINRWELFTGARATKIK